MRHKERIDVKNIKEKEIVKVVSIGQKDVRFRLQNAYVGQVGDNTELLDETLVDNMLELMAKAVKTNYSKYNPVPNEIIIRNTMSEKKEDKPADNKESQDMIESYEPRFAEQFCFKSSSRSFVFIAENIINGNIHSIADRNQKCQRYLDFVRLDIADVADINIGYFSKIFLCQLSVCTDFFNSFSDKGKIQIIHCTIPP